MPSLSLLIVRPCAGLSLAALAVVAGAQSPAASPPSPTTAYRSGTVPTVGPDVDLSNTGRAGPMAPVGVAPAATGDTLGSDSDVATPVGQPAPMGGFGPLAPPRLSPAAEPASAAALPQPEPARSRRRPQKEGTGPDGTANPGGKGVVIISPQR